MTKAIIFLAEGFEEIEALSTIDILRRGGVNAVGVALEQGIVRGSRGINIVPDAVIGDIADISGYDAFILPGGLVGMENLKASSAVHAILRDADANGKIVAAICASPIALDAAGIIRGREYTSYPSCEEFISSGRYRDDSEVVTDGNLITSRGPATSFRFAIAILKALKGAEVATSVADGLLLCAESAKQS